MTRRKNKVLARSALPDAAAAAHAAAAVATAHAASSSTTSEILNMLLLWQQQGSSADGRFLSAEWWTSTLTHVDTFYGTLPPAAPTVTMLLLALHGVAAVSHNKFAHPPKGYQTGYEPYARGRYDPDAAATYYQQHPWLVLRRAVEVLRLSYVFLWNWGLDAYVWKSEPVRRQQHAHALVELITRIGPTAIKVGQVCGMK
jgi:hypothetical protein